MATIGLRKPEKALTAKQVESTLAPGKYFDGHGLFLRVQPNGQRQWVQRITIRGKRCEIGLGNPSLVTLAKARETAPATDQDWLAWCFKSWLICWRLVIDPCTPPQRHP